MTKWSVSLSTHMGGNNWAGTAHHSLATWELLWLLIVTRVHKNYDRVVINKKKD